MKIEEMVPTLQLFNLIKEVISNDVIILFYIYFGSINSIDRTETIEIVQEFYTKTKVAFLFL